MSLIDDAKPKGIARYLAPTGQGLNRCGNHDIAGHGSHPAFFHAGDDARDRAYLAGCLSEKLFAMRDNKCAARHNSAGDLGENDRFARSGRQGDEGRGGTVAVGGNDGPDGFGLVGAEFEGLTAHPATHAMQAANALSLRRFLIFR